MNKLRQFSFGVALVALLAGPALAQQKTHSDHKAPAPNTPASKTPAQKTPAAKTPAPKASAGDEFFIVSSVDRAHNALVLLRPTQIATSFQVNDKTQYFDENGKPLKLADIRAGDTLFATFMTNADGTFTVNHVRKGMMTVNELRRRYSPGLPADAGTSATKSH
jgi:hypothetical protein